MAEAWDITVEPPPAFKPLFEHLRPGGPQRPRWRGLSGGRGSGKSWAFATALVLDMVAQHTRAVAAREMLRSLADSSKQLIEDTIRQLGGERFFRFLENEIVYPPTESVVIFRGLSTSTGTAPSIKSLEGYNRIWVDEGQQLTASTFTVLGPTFRTADATLDFSWNPISENDPVDRFFRENRDDPDVLHIQANYDANPFFPDVLRADMERDRARDYSKYEHVWLGQYLSRSEARVFKNFTVETFPDPPEGTALYYGADFGYAKDPACLVRAFIVGRKLYVDHEAWQVGCPIDKLPALFDTVPGSRKWPIVCDSSRPDTINYLRRQGFFRVRSSIKGKGSVEDGLEWLQKHDIVVHPRCVHVIDELSHYCWKTDVRTGEIMPVLADRDNHTIDGLRYSIEPVRRGSTYTLDGVS